MLHYKKESGDIKRLSVGLLYMADHGGTRRNVEEIRCLSDTRRKTDRIHIGSRVDK